MKFLKTLLFLLSSATLLAAAEKPNIIVILADDMGFSDIGCYGGEIETPHLDGLAKNGLRFTQFYNAARCCPTRASLSRRSSRTAPEARNYSSSTSPTMPMTAPGRICA